jgi:hypothetical protein
MHARKFLLMRSTDPLHGIVEDEVAGVDQKSRVSEIIDIFC